MTSDQRIKTTLVMGASDNPARYSYLAVHRLRGYGFPVRAIGRKKVTVADVEVHTEQVPWKDIDTITLYLNPLHQEPYYDYFMSLKPRRIIFNPGTENPELEMLASEAGIDCIEACTLVMLGTGQYD
ncbi:MAG: CoA-binding protein [Chitinophagaceae bacterium]|nr:CoA-binding protein [Chitinophagaceae bacterium]